MTPTDREKEIAREIVDVAQLYDTIGPEWCKEIEDRIAEALRAHVRAVTAERDALAAVWRTVCDDLAEWTQELDAEPVLDAAVAAGLYERVLYDPAIHGDEVDAEADEDFIYVLTPLGRRLAATPQATPEGT